MTKIEQQVMAGVAVVYAARMLASATAIKLYALTLSLGGVALFASVPNVVHNFAAVAAQGPGSVAFFVVYAVLGTTIVVQFALAMGAVAFLSLLISGTRSLMSGKAATA